MKRKNYPVNVPLTKEQKEKILKKANVCGMTMAGYIRYVALKVNPKSITI